MKWHFVSVICFLSSVDGYVNHNAYINSKFRKFLHFASTTSMPILAEAGSISRDKEPVQEVLNKLQTDMDNLDEIAGKKSQLSEVELTILLSSVALSAAAPVAFGEKVVEVLVPTMAALSAGVGISAEYVGKVAVANGREIAALALQATAESEMILAQAERVKAIIPLCVGVSATAAAFSLLAPALAKTILKTFKVEVWNEFFFVCPWVALIAAAVGQLASVECKSLCAKAMNLGQRRFASSNAVGNTWLSEPQRIEKQVKSFNSKWISFGKCVAPAPLIAALMPGVVSFQAVICTAIAAAQAAYYLAVAEYAVAAGTDAVAAKAKAAAIAETYANQGARAGSILPFTSALGGLCAAAAAAAAEVLPFIENMAGQVLVAALFPTTASLFAAAATVSKSRCEADALAAAKVASEGMVSTGSAMPRDPKEAVRELVRLVSSQAAVRMKMEAGRFRVLIAGLVAGGILGPKLIASLRKLVFKA